jgi:Type VI secretion system/phage-baseplate injector OB domain
MGTPQFGKFRGTVVNNVDPEQVGRLQLQVPDVLGATASGWALPSFPPGVFSIPAVGSSVWVEFEAGNLDSPIWSGCFFNSAAEVPKGAAALPAGQPAVLISAGDGGALVVDSTKAQLSTNAGATILLTGPTVDLNTGGLTVT